MCLYICCGCRGGMHVCVCIVDVDEKCTLRLTPTYICVRATCACAPISPLSFAQQHTRLTYKHADHRVRSGFVGSHTSSVHPTHNNTHAHPSTYIHSFSLFVSCTHIISSTHTLSHTYTHSLSISYTHTHTHTLSVSCRQALVHRTHTPTHSFLLSSIKHTYPKQRQQSHPRPRTDRPALSHGFGRRAGPSQKASQGSREQEGEGEEGGRGDRGGDEGGAERSAGGVPGGDDAGYVRGVYRVYICRCGGVGVRVMCMFMCICERRGGVHGVA